MIYTDEKKDKRRRKKKKNSEIYDQQYTEQNLYFATIRGKYIAYIIKPSGL